MNQRTEKEGRQLVEDFKASGKTQREYAKEHGIKTATLQYWVGRLRKAKKQKVQNRFVEISIPQTENVGAVQITADGVSVSLSNLPPARWLAEFIGSIEK
jgi:transposase-like protein